MKYVLIILSGGIIDQVTFYDDPHRAVLNLSDYVKAMDPEKHDAAVYGPDGLIANAKLFLNEYDQHPGQNPADKPIYIIANPCHSLGFLVISSTEPVGITSPVNALCVLERMRKEHGDHIKLYRAEVVKGPVMLRNQAFSLLYLNPPYDWSVRNDEVSASERHEKIFLKDTIKYLMPGGVLVYLIPQARLDKTIAKILAYRFDDVRVFRFPDKEYRAFKQVVVFGVLKKKPELDDRLIQYLTDVGQSKAIIHSIENANCDYAVLPSPAIKNFLFRTIRIDPIELEIEIKKFGLNAKINQMVWPMSLSEKIKPIMPLRHGHLAQLLACGMMNGVVFDKDGANPLVVKGITRKEVETRTEHDDGKEKIIETDRIVITINALNQKGELFTIT